MRREEGKVVHATTISQPITVQQIGQLESRQSVQQSAQQTTVGVNCQGCDPPEPLTKDGTPNNWSVPLSAEQTTTERIATEVAVQQIDGDLMEIYNQQSVMMIKRSDVRQHPMLYGHLASSESKDEGCFSSLDDFRQWGCVARISLSTTPTVPGI